jgi:transcription initiation factor TFIID subunit 6
MSIETVRSLNPDDIPEPARLAGHVLRPECQQFFRSAIRLLRHDCVDSFNSTLTVLVSEDRIHPLIPYFLQWAFGRMVLDLDSGSQLVSVLALVTALAKNRYVNVALFVHSFLKIALSGLLSDVLDDDVEVRLAAAKLLRVVCHRAEKAFPQMRVLVCNRLIDTVFGSDSCLGSYYGALLALRELQFPFDRYGFHFRSLRSVAQIEMAGGNFPQTLWATRICELLSELNL